MKMMKNLIITLDLLLVLIRMTEGSLEKEIATGLNRNQTILSRRKRYIVFPEGSSFQLVYCLTMPTYGMGQIFTMGLTAALAWELPNKPIHLKDQDKENDDKDDSMANKRIDTVENTTEITGNVPPRPYYHNPWITNYNLVNKTPYYNYYPSGHFIPTDYQNGYQEQLPAYKDERIYYKHRDVHRRTRRDLFEKIEKFFMALNKDGRACLLKALCEVNQIPKGKLGNFVEEILKAVFTWIPDEINDLDEYDEASIYKNDCNKKYLLCKHSVFDKFI